MTSVGEQLHQIGRWDRSRCSVEWAKLTGHRPQAGLSIGFLRRALAFEFQCRELNGHTGAVKRQLKGISTERKQLMTKSAAPSSTLTLGTQLVREWNGRIYRVTVTEHGFEWDGTTYASLSAVAKHITGAEWSGPRFFGIKKR